jgi:hypothetical protein
VRFKNSLSELGVIWPRTGYTKKRTLFYREELKMTFFDDAIMVDSFQLSVVRGCWTWRVAATRVRRSSHLFLAAPQSPPGFNRAPVSSANINKN